MSAFIKIGDIVGECKDSQHDGWTDLASFSQGMTKPGGGATGQTRLRGDVICDDFHCVKELDKSSPKIAEAVCLGTIFPEVKVDITASVQGAGRATYYSYLMERVMVTNYQLSGEGQSDKPPMENFSLNYEKITVTYHEVDSAGDEQGTIEFNFDVIAAQSA